MIAIAWMLVNNPFNCKNRAYDKKGRLLMQSAVKSYRTANVSSFIVAANAKSFSKKVQTW